MQVVRLTACGRNLALPVTSVREVAPASIPTAVFHAPSFLLGLMNLRGEPVPVLDPGLLFGWSAGGCEAPYVVIVEWNGLQVGLAASPPVDIVEVAEEGGRLVPPDGDTVLEAVERMAEVDGVPLLLLHPERFFSLPALRALRVPEELLGNANGPGATR